MFGIDLILHTWTVRKYLQVVAGPVSFLSVGQTAGGKKKSCVIETDSNCVIWLFISLSGLFLPSSSSSRRLFIEIIMEISFTFDC